MPKGVKPADMEGSQYVRSEALRELFDIGDGELPLKTNTPPRMVPTFTLMETSELALDLTRTDPLTKCYRDVHDVRMIGKGGHGRLEIVTVTQGTMKEDEEALDLW